MLFKLLAVWVRKRVLCRSLVKSVCSKIEAESLLWQWEAVQGQGPGARSGSKFGKCLHY